MTAPGEGSAPFEALDFVYMPSTDAAADVAHFTTALGARVVFAIEAAGTRVAMVQLTDGPPAVLFAEHLGGERPILVYRVADLEAALSALRGRGWQPGPQFGIPHGPGRTLDAPGGHRIAVYELTRPQAGASLAGRRDF